MKQLLAILLLCVSAFGQQVSLTRNVKDILPRKNGGLGVGAINSYGGSIASASTITVACNQSLTVTGATTINTITMASPSGCAVVLIAGAGATWSTGISGNISAVVTPAPGNAAFLVSDGTKFNPALGGAVDPVIALGPLQVLQGKPNVLTPTQQAANLAYLLVSDFDFPAQTPGGTLTGGSPATVMLAPCPLGVAGANTHQYLRISAGTGTAEPVVITGGSCVSGGASGSVTFIPANNHGGAWQLASDSGGLREAVLYSGGGAILQLAANHTILVSANEGVVFDKDNLILQSANWASVIKARDGAAMNQVITSSACNTCSFFNFGIDGNRLNGGTNPTFGVGLQLGTSGVGGANHVRVSNLEIFHSAKFGILLTDSNTDIDISTNNIHDNGGVTDGAGAGAGIYVYWVTASGNALATGVRVADNYISENHNTITNAGPSGCVAFKAAAITVSRNYCLNNYNDGGQIVFSMGPLGASAALNGPAVISENTVIKTATGLAQTTSGIEVDSPHATIGSNSILGHDEGGGVALEGNTGGPSGGIGASDTIVSANNIRSARGVGVSLNNAGGKVRGTVVTGNRIAVADGVAGVYVDTASLSTVIGLNNFSDTTTQISDNSADGVFTFGNYPQAANFAYGGTIASADSIAMRCGQVATISGSTAIRFITLPASTAGANGAGCSAVLIPDTGSTWATGLTGNIGKASTAVVGKALMLFSDGTLFWPSY